jgi:predicted ATPase
MAELREGVSDILKSMEYLGPIRPEPQRIYTLDKLFGQRLLKRGLSAWRDFLGDEVGQEKVSEIKSWLQHLGLGEEIELEKTELKRTSVTISALRVYEALTRPSINLSDMGYGASQVLPVIVQSVLAKEGSLVIIEQPELHLHPRAQAQLADLFIKMKSIGVRFLIETHSENLLLRFRRRIAQTSGRVSEGAHVPLERADLKAYFVERQNQYYRSSEV